MPAVTPLLDDRLDHHDDDHADDLDDDDWEREDIFWGPIKERALFSDKSTLGHIACQSQTVPCHEIPPLLLPTYHRFPHFPINQHPLGRDTSYPRVQLYFIPGKKEGSTHWTSQVDLLVTEQLLQNLLDL